MLYGIALLYGATGLDCRRDRSPHERGAVHRGAGRPAAAARARHAPVGLAFKVSAVPFHLWTPDVYEGAPTSVTAFMSTAVKAAAFVAAIRIFIVAMPLLAPHFSLVLWRARAS